MRLDRKRYQSHERGTCLLQRDMKRCYVSIPKCGSTSIKSLVGASIPPNATSSEWEWSNFYDEDLTGYTTFAIVRNPTDRFLSSFVEARRLGKMCGKPVPGLNDLPHVLPKRRDAHFERQCWFIEDAPLDRLLRLEHIYKADLEDLLGMKLEEVPHKNAMLGATPRDLLEQLTPETRHWIYAFYWIDLSIWRDAICVGK